MSLATDPAVFLRQLLVDNWDPENTDYESVPRIVTGWVQNDDWNKPQICVMSADESPEAGGNTGYFGVQPNGLPMKRMNGNITVSCQTHENLANINTDAKSLVYQMSEEVRRIINQYYLDPGGGLVWLSFFSRASLTDTVRRPIIFRQDCVVRYGYDDRL
jgi:hypothetical protein